MYQTKWACIHRGKNGWAAESFDGSTSSGGLLEDRVYSDGEKRLGYLSNAIDGAVVYDAENADYAAFAALVVAGPILKMCLYGVRKFDRETGARMLPALEDGFHSVTQLALAQPPEQLGSLDYCDWATYRKLLEKIAGVRFGVVRGGQVVWELEPELEAQCQAQETHLRLLERHEKGP